MNQRKKITIGLLSFLGVASIGLALQLHAKSKPFPTVKDVDINKYMGKWFEVARLPASFQKNCTNTTAEYTLNENGTVKVDNKCLNAKTGKNKESIGKARVVDGTGNASLKVTFFWPFAGDYNIIALDKDYKYAMVGTKNRKYCWILSRTKDLEEKTKSDLIAQAYGLGFETNKFIWASN